MPEIFSAWFMFLYWYQKRVFIADPKMTVWTSKNVFQWKESINLLYSWVWKQLIDQCQQVEPRQMALICAFVNMLTMRRQFFQWIKKLNMRFLFNPSESQPCKPENLRRSSTAYLKSLGYIFCLELLIENYDCHF